MSNANGVAKGKVIVMTGATDGMGKVAAERLLKSGARLVVIARKSAKTDEALHALQNIGEVSVVYADLASLVDIRLATAEIAAREEKIDVLINNAGVMKSRAEASADGFEMSIAVNHLAVAAVTLPLLSRVLAAAAPRIVNVNSAGHAMTLGGIEVTVEFDSWQLGGPYDFTLAYSRSKLVNLMWTYELARRVAASGITVNALHPASVPTSLDRELPRAMTQPYHAMYSTTLENGAAPIVRLAIADDVAQTSGKYFDGMNLTPSSPISYDTQLQHRVWEETAKITALDTPPLAARSIA